MSGLKIWNIAGTASAVLFEINAYITKDTVELQGLISTRRVNYELVFKLFR